MVIIIIITVLIILELGGLRERGDLLGLGGDEAVEGLDGGVLLIGGVLKREKRELEYRTPRSHSPGNSPRFPEKSGDVRRCSCGFSWKTVFSHLLQEISVENRSPYPVLKYSYVYIYIYI